MEEQSKFPSIIELNVGGQFYTTSLLTLTKCPGNMLSAMFSGNYTVVCDKEGRYFIDADGSNFVHILNYLRYGALPGPDHVEDVYREATYFGIHELVKALETSPKILSKLQRENFRKCVPGYTECVDSILCTAQEAATALWTDVRLLLFKREQAINVDGFDKNHECTCSSVLDPSKAFRADAKLGPWAIVDSCESDILECILYDLKARGFNVTARPFGTCEYSWNTYSCIKRFYLVAFHWWQT